MESPQIENPEAVLDRVRATYRAKGYDNTWIEERIKNDLVRNELTDEWKERGAKEGIEYAVLTNEISKGTFDLTVQTYKTYKLLPNKENLRDHMTTIEPVLCSLGEATATLYHRNRDSQGFPRLQRDAIDAGELAGRTRKEIEQNIGKSIVSPENRLELKKGRGKTKTSGNITVEKNSEHLQKKEQKRLQKESQPSLFDDPASSESTT